MKATGIVRRIDDLGRVVIPKEIRRTMRIREGDPLEIFVDREGKIILKKYSPLGELGEFAQEYAEALNENTGYLSIIVDQDAVVAAAGIDAEEYIDKRISPVVGEIVQQKDQVHLNSEDNQLCEETITADEEERYTTLIISPISNAEQPLGAVIMAVRGDEEGSLGQLEYKLTRIAADFLGKQID